MSEDHERATFKKLSYLFGADKIQKESGCETQNTGKK